jgi:hypothetical protein
MMRPIFILITFLLSCFQLLYAQEKIDFEISVAGFSIGEMHAIKTLKGNDTFYEIRSEVGFGFLEK